MARPRIPIDPEQVEILAAVGCTVAQIAATLGCSKDTLERRFAAAIEKGREKGNTSLLKKQFDLALNGNPTMLIWLGKQRLGQSDKREDKRTLEIKDPREMSDEELEAERYRLGIVA